MLPVKITFWLLVGLVIVLTLVAPYLKWRRTRTFLFGSLVAVVAFVPSLFGVSSVVDTFRFGHFQHASFADVNDFRIERWLPPDATDISLFKNYGGNGYRARFTISEEKLIEYLDELWQAHAHQSAIQRHEFSHDGKETSGTAHFDQFQIIGWNPIAVSIVYHSPVEGDGGGATYYHDRNSGVTLQRAGYW